MVKVLVYRTKKQAAAKAIDRSNLRIIIINSKQRIKTIPSYVHTKEKLILSKSYAFLKIFLCIVGTIGFCHSPQDYTSNTYLKIKLLKINPHNT